MVTPEEFDRVQVLLGRKDRPRRRIHNFTFTGMIRCGQCGAMITAEEKFKLVKATGLNKRYVYYHCTHRKNPSCRQGSIEEADLKRQVDDFLKKMTLPREYLDWIFKYLDEVKDTEKSKTESALESARKELERTDARLKNLLALKISPENVGGDLLSDREFLKEKNRLVREKLQLESSINEKADINRRLSELTRKTFCFSAYARIWFAKGDRERQRTILSGVGSNLTIRDGRLLIQAKNFFIPTENHLAPIKQQLAGFEPKELGRLNAKTAAFDDRFRILRGVVTEVRTKIRQILSNPRRYKEELHSFTSLCQIQSTTRKQ
jgi:predicted metal-binding protein